VLDGQIFLVGGCDGGCGDVAGSQLMDVQVKVIVSSYHGFLPFGDFVDIIGEEAVGGRMGCTDRLRIAGGRQAIDVTFALVDPILDKRDIVFLFDGEVLLVGRCDGSSSDLARAEVVDVDIEVAAVRPHLGCLSHRSERERGQNAGNNVNPDGKNDRFHANSDLKVKNELMTQNNSFFGMTI
jgi:hypothetical protein